MTDARTSLRCWLALSIIIFTTVGFMLSFYQHAIQEISDNSQFNNEQISHHILNKAYPYEEEQ